MPRPLPGSQSPLQRPSSSALPGEHVGIDDVTPRYLPGSDFSELEEQILRELIHWWQIRRESGMASLATPISAHLALPDLRAYWPGSSLDHTRVLYDISGQGRHLTPTGSGAPYPYLHLRTPTVLLSRHDDVAYTRPHEAALSLTTGLTMGAWVRLSGAALPATLMGKMGASGTYSFALALHAQTAAASTWRFYHSDDGVTSYGARTSSAASSPCFAGRMKIASGPNRSA
jgi:hypothetical protein